MKPFENADQCGDPRELILTQGRTVAALDAVEGAGRNPKKSGGLRVRQVPGFTEAKERLERDLGQAGPAAPA